MIKNLLTYSLLALQALCSMGAYGQVLEEDRVFYSYDASNGLADNSVQIVICTKTGRLLISTIGHINFFDGHVFKHVDPKEGDTFPLPGYKGDYQLFFDKFHRLWGKHQGRMTCIDLLTERFSGHVSSVVEQAGVQGRADDLFGDSDNNMWFLVGKRLVAPTLDKAFDLRDAEGLLDLDVYEDSLLLLFYADASVAAYDYRTGRFIYRDDAMTGKDARRFQGNSILCRSGETYYQLLNSPGVSRMQRYSLKTRQWSTLLETPYGLNSMSPKDSLLYIASDNGYLVYCRNSGEIKFYDTLRLTKGRSLNARINSIAFDRQGGMWLGTSLYGLLYSKPYPSLFMSYLSASPEGQHFVRLLDRQVEHQQHDVSDKWNCRYRDSRGWLWTGTLSGLLLEKDGRQVMYTQKDGMPNEVIHAIVEDDSHNIWANTSYGLVHLLIRGDSVNHLEAYVNQDNVPTETFLNNRAARLDDGVIVMQSLNRVMVFDPAQFWNEQLNEMVLYPKLTGLMVNGMVVEAGMALNDRVILEKSITRTREFHVNYNQNSIVLTFSGLNYLRPMQTYYRIRVKGVAPFSDWKVLGYGKSGGMVDRNGMLHLPLIGMAPGQYTIELQASLWPDSWPQEPFIWKVYVDQPWWRSTGIYLLSVFLLVVFLALNLLYLNRNMRLRMVLYNEQRDFIRRLRNLVSRYDALKYEVLTPQTVAEKEESQLQADYDSVMVMIMPYVQKYGMEDMTISRLAAVVGMDTVRFYELLSAQMDKTSRVLLLKMRLDHAKRLLTSTGKSIEDIAEELHFASPSFLIASFYHYYRMTPQDYRKSKV